MAFAKKKKTDSQTPEGGTGFIKHVEHKNSLPISV